ADAKKPATPEEGCRLFYSRIRPGLACSRFMMPSHPRLAPAAALQIHYSILTPAVLTTSAHFSRFSRTVSRKSATLEVWTVFPLSTRRLATLGAVKALVAAALMRWTVSASMPLGPNRPNQMKLLKPGRPDSAMVGTSLTTSTRSRVDTPSRRTLPAWYCPNT